MISTHTKACDIDSHGLACKASALADQALETAYTVGVLDERTRVEARLKELGYDILEINRILESNDDV